MSDTTTNRLLAAALSGLVLALSATTAEARSPVGVTTASDGDPLGKPPNENERILRIGIDVQANELVTTAARDRAHLVFLDGSSLTVGPNARVVIDRFVYDPATNTGDLAINASRGVFRLVGGRISKQKPIVITTPSSTIGVRGGITI
ncbi:MAG TPA: FecR domain-containing protein, partial [Reyranella sp.]|nr:FecR domain-containing protein [Reyranella sp.]